MSHRFLFDVHHLRKMPGPKHPLKSKWLLSYIPLITPEMESQHGGDYDTAARAEWRKVDHITTIEEMWSTVNSLPQWTSLPPRDQMIFSREDTEPFLQNFPNGCRISVFTEMKNPGKSALEAVLISVIGEGVTTATDGEPMCDLVRIMRKPNARSSDAMHIEVWLRDESKKDAVLKYLKGAVHREFPSTKVLESYKK
jgi:hypothetical protein